MFYSIMGENFSLIWFEMCELAGVLGFFTRDFSFLQLEVFLSRVNELSEKSE